MQREEKIGKQTIFNGIRRENFRLHPEGELKFSEGCITVVNSIDFSSDPVWEFSPSWGEP